MIEGKAVTIRKSVPQMNDREFAHYACFRARCAYFIQFGIDLPIERFQAEKDSNGVFTVTIKEEPDEKEDRSN